MNQTEFLQLAQETNGKIEKRSFENIDWDFTLWGNMQMPSSILFNECSFLGEFRIKNCPKHLIPQLIFEYCDLKEVRCVLTSNEIEYLEFSHCKIKSLQVENCQLHYLYLNENSISSIFRLLGANINFATIENGISSKINRIYINSQEIDELFIRSLSFSDLLVLNSFSNVTIKGTFKEIKIHSRDFNDLKIQGEDKLSYNKIENLTINDSSSNGLINISNLEIEKFELINFINFGGAIRLNDLTIQKAFFNDTSIGKLYWDQINFVKHLEILRCDLFGLKFSHVGWLKEHKLSNSFLDKKRTIESKINDVGEAKTNVTLMQYERDVYRQLKAASFNNQNLPEALAFYRNEMRLYWKEIRINGGANWQDRILVFLNRWVSDFGQSWLLPLVWLFGAHFLLFMSIYEWQFSKDINDFKTGLGEYFQLLNPVHKTPDYINTGMGLFTEFWMRVLSGFFIYHFIRATRKFAKI